MMNNGGLSFVLSVIYGDNTQSSRKELWQDPKQLCASQRSVPLILLRDFDVCRFADKKNGGKSLSVKASQDFK